MNARGVVLLPLTQGAVTMIDAEDAERVAALRWRLHNRGYAFRTETVNGRCIGVLLHRWLTDAPDGLDVDHRDGDRLNNCKSNLRVCTREENLHNSRPRGGSSRFKGVSYDSRSGLWVASICLNYAPFSLGRFEREDDAARRYDEVARDVYGEFARLNFPM